MRGKAFFSSSVFIFVRITPAYAGKSKKLNFLIVQKKDHPRLCGEKFGDMTFDKLSKGSPPPMRGKVLRRAVYGNLKRITPAYAGKRLCAYSASVSRWDHPRLCGEKFFWSWFK